MTKTELDGYKKQLLALQTRLSGDISSLQDEAFKKGEDVTGGNLSHLPLHMADLGSDNFEQENTLQLLKNEEQILSEIDAALERINNGKFGKCEDCDSEVTPKARLKELPYTRYCFECANKRDSGKS